MKRLAFTGFLKSHFEPKWQNTCICYINTESQFMYFFPQGNFCFKKFICFTTIALPLISFGKKKKTDNCNIFSRVPTNKINTTDHILHEVYTIHKLEITSYITG